MRICAELLCQILPIFLNFCPLMEPICLFPVSGIILRTCFRLFADSDVAFVFLADKLARFCHHIGKVTCWLVVCWLELCSDIITRVKRYWADSADGFIIL